MQRACEDTEIVRIWRTYDGDPEIWIDGRIVAENGEFVCVQVIDDRIQFDGYLLFLIDDITTIQVPGEHSEFYAEALRLRGETVESIPEIDMRSFRRALESLIQIDPLVAIHRESVVPGASQIGRVLLFRENDLVLQEINPDAEWDDTPAIYRYDEITLLEFGTGYHEALALVGGAGNGQQQTAES